MIDILLYSIPIIFGLFMSLSLILFMHKNYITDNLPFHLYFLLLIILDIVYLDYLDKIWYFIFILGILIDFIDIAIHRNIMLDFSIYSYYCDILHIVRLILIIVFFPLLIIEIFIHYFP